MNVRWVAHAACWLFYRVDRVGGPPPDGAVMLLPNHANALLDPAIVWATAQRDVRFLAKSTLFEGPLRLLLRAAGAIPVYRKLDRGADVAKNAETFAAVDAALAAHQAICIFPEGISHSTGRLEPLRTGAARMALSAERAGTPVALVPVGLNFDRKAAFRSRVTIVYGPAFSCRDLVDDSVPHVDAVRALTGRIAAHMRDLLVEADPEADARLVGRVDQLYAAARGRPSDAADHLQRRRAIAAGITRLRSRNQPRYDELLLQLRRYDERLRRFGIRDRHLDWNVSAVEAARFAARESMLAVVLVPLAAVVILLFTVPYRATAAAARRATAHADMAATVKVIGGAVIYAVWLALIVAVAWLAGGRGAAVAAALLTPALAIAGLFAIERESAVLDTARSWFLLRRARHETLAQLLRHRSELADVLDEVHQWVNDGSRQ